MRTITSYSLRLIALLVSYFVEWVKLTFTPPRERRRGLITFVAGKVKAVAYEAVSWCYAMYARFRVDPSSTSAFA